MKKEIVDSSEKTLVETVAGGDEATPEKTSSDPPKDTDVVCNDPSELKVRDDMEGSDENEETEAEENPSASNHDVFVMDGCYYKRTVGRNPRLKMVSNFTIEARAKVVLTDNWFYQCVGTRSTDEQYMIELFRDEFLSATALKRALSVNSNFEYYGNNYDTTQIQGLLTDQNPPTVNGTDKNGIHLVNDRLVYVEGDHVVDKDGPACDIVYMNRHSQAHRTPCLLNQPDISRTELKAIASDLYRFNGSTIVYPVLGYIGYCFAKEAITSKVDRHNPFMLLHGDSGVGKSQTIERLVLPIFSSRFPFANIANETQYTLAHNSNATNTTPVCYDEYKNAVLSPSQKRLIDNVLLSSYAQTPIERGRPDKTIANLRFTAPFILSGEMTLDSTSLNHRRIDVFYSYSKREGTEDNFKRLARQPLGSFGKALLYHTLQIGSSRLCQELDKQSGIVDSSIDDRFRDNAALIRTGLWLITDYLESNGIAVDCYKQGFEIIDSVIKESINAAKISNVDKTVSDFCTMAGDGVLVDRVDYEVKNNCLRLKITTVYSKYQRWVKRNGTSECIGKNSFFRQLAEKKYFIDKKTMRIGGNSCNAVSLNLANMPEDIDMDWPGYNNFGSHKVAC